MIEGRTIDTGEKEFEFDLPLTNGTCSMQTDIVIALDAFSGIQKVNHGWQKVFTKSLVSHFDSSSVRISVNPMSRDHAALENPSKEDEPQEKICNRLDSLYSGALKYRGYHFYEGFYPEAAERWFKDSVRRNKAIIFVKHLADNEPETVIDFRHHFIIEKLFKLAGHPDQGSKSDLKIARLG